MTTTVNKIDPKAALRRFALAITILNIAGHLFLGFEQSYAYPFVSLLTTYSLEFLYEFLFTVGTSKKPRYSGGITNFIDFLLSAHISGLAISMLLYSNESLWPIVFAATVAISSKVIFRVKISGKSRHFLNPSNTGIALTLLLFPTTTGIAPPYQFTENIFSIADWILPLVFILIGTMLNYKFTKKIILIIAWLIGFMVQAFIRYFFFDSALVTALIPFTGVAFLLFTFYMISDPATTPDSKNGQIIFGFSTAMVYGILMIIHIAFGLFFSLIIICSLRGCILYLQSFRRTNFKYLISLLNPVK